MPPNGALRLLKSDLKPDRTGWCVLSERRLFQLMCKYKPAGTNAHIEMMHLAFRMSFVGSDEGDDAYSYIDSPIESKATQSYKKWLRNASGVKFYEPMYSIRPTPKQIWDKLNTIYQLSAIDSQEGVPEHFTVDCEFFLPDGLFSELLRKREDERQKGTSSRMSGNSSTTPLNRPSRKSTRQSQRIRRVSGETDGSASRASTPPKSARK